jgi:hypothetical protein
MSEQEWHDDDRLLHEMVWAAEGFLVSMSNNKAHLPIDCVEGHINLKRWANLVRQTWDHRDDLRQSSCTCVRVTQPDQHFPGCPLFGGDES